MWFVILYQILYLLIIIVSIISVYFLFKCLHGIRKSSEESNQLLKEIYYELKSQNQNKQ